eukprot:14506-Heterococcus_DN1.PRE.1
MHPAATAAVHRKSGNALDEQTQLYTACTLGPEEDSISSFQALTASPVLCVSSLLHKKETGTETRATSVSKECLRKETVKHKLCNTHGYKHPAVHV